MGLAALSYLLKLDGQNSIAEKYDQLNKGFISFWMEKALVRIYMYNSLLLVAAIYVRTSIVEHYTTDHIPCLEAPSSIMTSRLIASPGGDQTQFKFNKHRSTVSDLLCTSSGTGGII